jgi:CheY-like chemotaxis protein
MKGWGRYALVLLATDADFGLRHQLGAPPRPLGGECKGYTVLNVPSGPTGIALTREYPMDAAVLDFEPGMDGNQVAQVMVKEKPALPIVISSGSPDEIAESLKWFADAVFHKGDGSQALLSAVDRFFATPAWGKKPLAPMIPEKRVVAEPCCR